MLLISSNLPNGGHRNIEFLPFSCTKFPAALKYASINFDRKQEKLCPLHKSICWSTGWAEVMYVGDRQSHSPEELYCHSFLAGSPMKCCQILFISSRLPPILGHAQFWFFFCSWRKTNLFYLERWKFSNTVLRFFFLPLNLYWLAFGLQKFIHGLLENKFLCVYGYHYQFPIYYTVCVYLSVKHTFGMSLVVIKSYSEPRWLSPLGY